MIFPILFYNYGKQDSIKKILNILLPNLLKALEATHNNNQFKKE